MLLVIPIGVLIVFRQISTQKFIRLELLEEKNNMDGTAVELMNGIEVIRVLDNAEFEVNRFDIKSEDLRVKEMKHHKAMAFYDCLKFINEAVFTVLIIGISAYLAAEGVISVGTVLTSYLCFVQLTTPLRELHRIFDELSESTILAKEYFKIIELPKDFSYLNSKKKSANSNVNIIEINNLNFKYPDNNKLVLSNLNLSISSGSFIGIARPSGCGKTSLIKIISKLEQASGDVYINGKNIFSLTRKEVATLMSLVPQTPFLIAGTIKDNICYGLKRKVSDDEVKEAAHRAFLDNYIDSLPDKYDTLVAESGQIYLADKDKE